MSGRLLVAGVVMVLAVGLSACSSPTAGQPTAATTSAGAGGSSGAPPSESDGPAPSVDNPKDLRGVDPCELISPARQSELGFTSPGEKGKSEWGEDNCRFFGSIVGIDLSPNSTLGDGLDRVYRNKDFFDKFEPTEVDGYPAVRVDFTDNSCGLITGVSDTQTLDMGFTRVSSSAPGKGDPCAFAESVMAEAIAALPGE